MPDSEARLENHAVVLTYLFSAAFLPADSNIKPNAPPLDAPLCFRKAKGEGDGELAVSRAQVEK